MMCNMATESKKKKLADILAEKGLGLNYKYGGDGTESNEIIEREDLGYKPTPRAEKLANMYYDAKASASLEFTYLYMRKFEELDGHIQMIRRARAMAYAFAHTTPVIFPGELIVGAKAPYLRGSFPNPQLIQSFFVNNNAELYEKYKKDNNARDAVDAQAQIGTGGGNVTADAPGVICLGGKFGLRAEEVPGLNRITSYWSGKTIEELGEEYSRWIPEFNTKNNLLRTLTSRADSAYTVPVGRTVLNFYYPLAYGLDGMIELCEKRAVEVAGDAGCDGILGMDRLYFYEAIATLTKGIQKWIENYAVEARRRVEITEDSVQKKEYEEIAEICQWVAHKPPRTFREAMQLQWFSQIVQVNEDTASGMSPGRLGLVLYPWFEQDIEAGRITEEEVLELLQLQRIKYTSIDLFVSTGSNSVLMGNTFNNVCVGGLTKEGKPACNRLEWLILHAAEALPTTQPTLSILWDERLPKDFVLKAAETAKLGTGYPAWMNSRVACDFLMDQYGDEGMTVQDARAFAIGGCLETAPCTWHTITLNGKEYEIPGGASGTTVNGVHFISNPKILEYVLFNGYDNRKGIQVLPPHNKKLETYEELWEQYKAYYEYVINVQRKCGNLQHDVHRKKLPTLWDSATKPDCLEKGLDIGNMGTRYNATFAVESTGTVNMVNSLAALKKLVYEDKKYSLEDYKDAILNNFGFYLASEVGNYSMGEQVKKDDGDKYDEIHSDSLACPKYGNNDPYADSILLDYERWFCPVCREFKSMYGLKMHAIQISVSTHGLLGGGCLATPDGRLGETTFGDASMSAIPGTDRKGPYALFESANIWDHSQSQNSQMNLKIHPSAIKGDVGTEHLANLATSYLSKGAFHIQFNVVDSKMLKKAQKTPENYRDLMVRVAGFTQYWVEIGKPIQDELIARTEYEGV